MAGTTRRTLAEAAIVVAAAFIGIVIGASIERSHPSAESAGPSPAGPATPSPRTSPDTGIVTGASAATLRALSKALGRPVYWNGPRTPFRYEVTLASNAQRVYVRYLPLGVPLGSPRADFLSVGTYSVPNATAALRAQARKPGGVSLKLPRGAVGFYSTARPNSVYLAYPGTGEQIEVYDPSPAVALQSVESGSVTPVR